MLSKTCKYSVRAVIYIAIHEKKGENIGIKRISEELNLPAPFLSKILQILSKNKILKSTKGPNGGFMLNKKPDDLSLLDIVEVIDGTDVFYDCMIGMKVCEDKPEKQELCPFHENLDTLKDKLLIQFEELTVGYFKKHYDKLDDALSF